MAGSEESLFEPPVGLVYRGGSDLTPRKFDVDIDSRTGLLKPTRGVSVHMDPKSLEKFGGAYRIKSLPEGLQLKQRGKDLNHYEIVPAEPMSFEQYAELLKRVILEGPV
ncbi:MAG TPA: hypothetical protein VGE45_17260 [Chloroflexia bacterium]|jgi:hypothetical protein